MTAPPTFRSSVAKTVALQGLVYAAAIATNTTVGRVLGRDGLGLYALANNFVVLSALALGGGLQFASPYFVGQDPARLRATFRATGWWVSLVTVLVGLLVLSGAHSALLGALVDVRGWQALLIIGVLPIFMVHQNAQMILLGLRRFLAYNLVPLAVVATTFLAVILLVVLGRRGTEGLLAAWALGNILGAVAACCAVLQPPRSSQSTDVRLRELLAVGARALTANTLAMLVWRADLFLLKGLDDRSAVGLYVAAVSISEMSLKIPLQIGAVLFPYVAAERSEIARLLAGTTLRHTVAAVTTICLALGVLGKPLLLLLYGGAYEAGYLVLLALLPGMVMWSAQVILNNYFAGRGYPRVTYLSPLAALAVDVALNFLLVPRWSALGTAVAASVSYAVWAVCLLVVFLRETRLTARGVLVLNRSDVSTALNQLYERLRRLQAAR